MNKTIADIRAAVDNSVDVAITNADGDITYVNDRFCALSKYSREELLGKNHRLLSSGLHSKEFFRGLWTTISAGEVWKGEICNRAKDGSLFWEQTAITPILDENGKPSQYVVLRHDITERIEAEQRLREVEENQRLATEAAQLGIWSTDASGRDEWSPLCRRILGVPPEVPASYSAYLATIHPEDRQRVEHTIARGFEENTRYSYEYRVIWPDGGVHWLATTGRAYRDQGGRFARAVGVVRDVTEARRAREILAQTEAQLRHSQKMEGIGRLAGGIAHDFNNILTAITGYGLLLQESLPPDDPRRQDAAEVIKAGERAAALTRQLLAFSRSQTIEPKVLDLNSVLKELENMLRRTIGENVELKFLPGKELGPVKADPGHIEQAVVNLAVNARDAMPEGGRLTIETANVELDEDYAATHPGCAPGSYVMICVSDNGCGMSDEVKAHLFEPFFTTKEKGKGTGLGLATIYGIVSQSRGHVYVYSEPGRGTAFKIYLPRVDEAAAAETRRAPETLARGSETLLLVEDDEMVHRFLARVLRENGYTVLSTRDPAEAVRLCEKNDLSLMLTDVVMPKMDGYALAERVAALRPKLKVIFMSGYTEHSIDDAGNRRHAPFLQKPVSSRVLLGTIRRLLDGTLQS